MSTKLNKCFCGFRFLTNLSSNITRCTFTNRIHYLRAQHWSTIFSSAIIDGFLSSDVLQCQTKWQSTGNSRSGAPKNARISIPKRSYSSVWWNASVTKVLHEQLEKIAWMKNVSCCHVLLSIFFTWRGVIAPAMKFTPYHVIISWI